MDRPNNTKKRFSLPIRKVPSMTGWPVDSLVELFTGKTEMYSKPLLIAYEYRKNETPVKILSRDWKNIKLKILDLSKKYHAMELRKGRQEYYDEWRHESLKEIPPNWFVWSNDLQKVECTPWTGH